MSVAPAREEESRCLVFRTNPREEEGAGPIINPAQGRRKRAGPKTLGAKARISGAATPGRRRGAAAIPTGSGRRKSRSNCLGHHPAKEAPNLCGIPREEEGDAAVPIGLREEEETVRIR